MSIEELNFTRTNMIIHQNENPKPMMMSLDKVLFPLIWVFEKTPTVWIADETKTQEWS